MVDKTTLVRNLGNKAEVVRHARPERRQPNRRLNLGIHKIRPGQPSGLCLTQLAHVAPHRQPHLPVRELDRLRPTNHKVVTTVIANMLEDRSSIRCTLGSHSRFQTAVQRNEVANPSRLRRPKPANYHGPPRVVGSIREGPI